MEERGLPIADDPSPTASEILHWQRTPSPSYHGYFISPDHLDIEQAVTGCGVYCDVRKAIVIGGQGEKAQVAIKRFRDKLEFERKMKLWSDFRREFQLLQSLDHPNVISVLAVSITSENFPMMIMPWADNGNLQRYLTLNPNADKLQLVREIAYGLEHIHSKGIVHSDLKPENILVSSSGHAMITDFNMSRFQDSLSAEHTEGTAPYSSKELLESQRPTFASDIHAFGMTVYEIFSGKAPYSDCRPPIQIVKKILDGKLPCVDDPSIFPPQIARLCRICWSLVPAQRPSAEQVADALRQLPNLISNPQTSADPSRRKFDGQRFLDMYIASTEEPLHAVINFISVFSRPAEGHEDTAHKWAKGKCKKEVTNWVKNTIISITAEAQLDLVPSLKEKCTVISCDCLAQDDCDDDEGMHFPSNTCTFPVDCCVSALHKTLKRFENHNDAKNLPSAIDLGIDDLERVFSHVQYYHGKLYTDVERKFYLHARLSTLAGMYRLWAS